MNFVMQYYKKKEIDIKFKNNSESEESDFNESEEELSEDIKTFSDELMKRYNFDTRKTEDTRKKEKSDFNENGINIDGLNKDGYNINGLNKDGLNKDGYNINGLNKDGLDKNGLNISGIEGNRIKYPK